MTNIGKTFVANRVTVIGIWWLLHMNLHSEMSHWLLPWRSRIFIQINKVVVLIQLEYMHNNAIVSSVLLSVQVSYIVFIVV